MTSPHPALGIDYGEARIGIAATDPVGIMAHPVETIHRHQTDGISRIVQLVQERGIRTLVLGLPVRMDGTEGTAAAKVRAFGRELAAALPGLPLIFMDECLTTVIAQEKLHAAGKKAKNFRPIIDQVAAVEILNTWLDSTLGWNQRARTRRPSRVCGWERTSGAQTSRESPDGFMIREWRHNRTVSFVTLRTIPSVHSPFRAKRIFSRTNRLPARWNKSSAPPSSRPAANTTQTTER